MKKKRLQLSEDKCVILQINSKDGAKPTLKINDDVMEDKEIICYLGDIFNKKGNNKDLIDDRVMRGKAAMIRALSSCDEVAMGCYIIEVLLMLYNSFFLSVLSGME